MRPTRRWAAADSPTRRTSSSSRASGTRTVSASTAPRGACATGRGRRGLGTVGDAGSAPVGRRARPRLGLRSARSPRSPAADAARAVPARASRPRRCGRRPRWRRAAWPRSPSTAASTPSISVGRRHALAAAQLLEQVLHGVGDAAERVEADDGGRRPSACAPRGRWRRRARRRCPPPRGRAGVAPGRRAAARPPGRTAARNSSSRPDAMRYERQRAPAPAAPRRRSGRRARVPTAKAPAVPGASVRPDRLAELDGLARRARRQAGGTERGLDDRRHAATTASGPRPSSTPVSKTGMISPRTLQTPEHRRRRGRERGDARAPPAPRGATSIGHGVGVVADAQQQGAHRDQEPSAAAAGRRCARGWRPASASVADAAAIWLAVAET